MLTRVKISNWQSLRDVDLALGRFTVIVGASNSGKTALIRALRAAANNPRRKGNITWGAKQAEVAVFTEQHQIAYVRTENTALYRLSGFAEPFTDLGGTVPEQITAALGIPPAAAGQSLHIAGQFDPPYLLLDSGAAVARTLGALTNVNIIFEAVKEANRRRAGLASTLKTRQRDLAVAAEQLRAFADLPAQLAAVDTAEQAARGVQQLSERMGRLGKAADTLQVAETVLARTAVPEIPDDTALLAAAARRSRFLGIVQQLRTANQAVAATTAALDQAAADETEAHQQLHDALVAAGACPTCGQPVTA